MWFGRIETAALNKIWIFRDDLINVHSGVSLTKKHSQVKSYFMEQWLWRVNISVCVLTFPVRMTTLVSGS